jgi:hypothetical protein
MATGKGSFLMYADYLGLFEQLSDEEAGKLIKHVLNYVNDSKPQTDDKTILVAFALIKSNLKRDLKSWEETRSERSKAGKASAEKRRKDRESKSTNVNISQQVQQVSTNPTVNVNVNVNVKNIYIPTIEECISFFELKEFSADLAKQAWEGYDANKFEIKPGVWAWKDSQGKLIKNWKMKMIQVWMKPENKHGKNKVNRADLNLGKDETINYEAL